MPYEEEWYEEDEEEATMDLTLDFNILGKGKAKDRAYWGEDLIQGTVKGKIFTIFAESFYCRDELIPEIARVMDQFHEEEPKFRLSASDKSLRVRYTDFSSVKGVRKYLELQSQAILGETNENFSMAASPYLLRWHIAQVRRYRTMPRYNKDEINKLTGRASMERVRSKLKNSGWFYEAMIEADKEGITLQDDLRVAWGMSPGRNYGMAGLEQLQILSVPFKFNQKAVHDPNYEKWFPPAVIIKKNREKK